MNRIQSILHVTRPRCPVGEHDFRVVLVAHVRRGDCVSSETPADGLAYACSRCGERRG